MLHISIMTPLKVSSPLRNFTTSYLPQTSILLLQRSSSTPTTLLTGKNKACLSNRRSEMHCKTVGKYGTTLITPASRVFPLSLYLHQDHDWRLFASHLVNGSNPTRTNTQPSLRADNCLKHFTS